MLSLGVPENQLILKYLWDAESAADIESGSDKGPQAAHRGSGVVLRSFESHSLSFLPYGELDAFNF